MAKSYLEYLKELTKKKEKDLFDVEEKYEREKTEKKNSYIEKIRETDKNFIDEIDKENVKRLIEERKFREAVGNLGLGDSGLKYKPSLNKERLTKSSEKERKNLEDEMKDVLNDLDYEKTKKKEKIEESFSEEKEKLKDSQKTSSKNTSDKGKGTEEAPEKEDDLSPDSYRKIGQVIKKLPTKREYLKESQVNDQMPDYEKSIFYLVIDFWMKGQITKEECNYILKLYGLEPYEEE